MSDLVLRDSDILSPEFGFDEKRIVAEKVAKSLANVIETNDLALNIKGNKYVTVDGWNTLGTMLGCTPYVESVEDVTDILGQGLRKKERIFKATVSLRKGDVELARASAICSNTEKYKDQEDFAIYSMAQTRAMGKVYRMALGWIMKLGGYESTPAEDMPKFKEPKKSNGEPAPMTPKKSKKEDDNVVEAEIVEPKSEMDYEDLINDMIEAVIESGVNVRKPAIIKQIKGSGLTDVEKEDLIDYVKDNLDNKELGAKYDKS